MFLCYFYYGASGVRVSGGHLCEAEAPTEPTDETAGTLQNNLTMPYDGRAQRPSPTNFFKTPII